MATFSELESEVARVGGLGSSTDDSTSATAWAKAGLRKIASTGAYTWLKTSFTVTLSAGVYEYSIYDIDPSLWRIDSKSLRYGGRGTYLVWRQISDIDGILEPTWRDAGSDSGVPRYVTREGSSLWIASKPSQDFIDEYSSIYGFGWRTENYSEDTSVNGGRLLLPDVFTEAAVCAALAYGWDEEDDPRADKMKNRFYQEWLPEMRGLELDVDSNNSMAVPGIGDDSTDYHWDGYGDW